MSAELADRLDRSIGPAPESDDLLVGPLAAPTTWCRRRWSSSTSRGRGSGATAAEEAYARTIIVRANIDESRRPWRRERPGPAGVETAAAEPLPVQERDTLFDALQALPTMQRRTVLLRHWLGLTVAKTAAELGIAEGTVKSHTSRGLAAPQQVLARA
jgi:DNA-directed RNA polymerase specialized sigma24 family protein